MALPFLPPEQIEEIFHHLDRRAGTAPLQALMDCIWRQWIRNPVFPIPNWSVFMLSVRTNNDLEGWHNRLNARVCRTGRVPFYSAPHRAVPGGDSYPFGCPSSVWGEVGKDQQEEDQPAEWEAFTGVEWLQGWTDFHIAASQSLFWILRSVSVN